LSFKKNVLKFFSQVGKRESKDSDVQCTLHGAMNKEHVWIYLTAFFFLFFSFHFHHHILQLNAVDSNSIKPWWKSASIS